MYAPPPPRPTPAAGKIGPATAAGDNVASNAITLSGPLTVLGHTTLASATVDSLTAVRSLTVKGSSKLGTGLRAGQLALQVQALLTGGC